MVGLPRHPSQRPAHCQSAEIRRNAVAIEADPARSTRARQANPDRHARFINPAITGGADGPLFRFRFDDRRRAGGVRHRAVAAPARPPGAGGPGTRGRCETRHAGGAGDRRRGAAADDAPAGLRRVPGRLPPDEGRAGPPVGGAPLLQAGERGFHAVRAVRRQHARREPDRDRIHHLRTPVRNAAGHRTPGPGIRTTAKSCRAS